MNYRPGDVKKLAVVVQGNPKQTANYSGTIDNEFLAVALEKGHVPVTQDSIRLAKEQLRNRGDEAFDISTAAEVGKLVHASHVLYVDLRVISPPQRQRGNQGRLLIAAKMITVETGEVVGAAQGEVELFDDPEAQTLGAAIGKKMVGGKTRTIPEKCRDTAREVASQFP